MPECTSCGAANPEGGKFCASCGKPIVQEPRPVFCAGCGTQNPQGSKFCKSCGAPLQKGPVSDQVTVSTTFSVAPDPITVRQLKKCLWIGAAIFSFSAADGFSNVYMVESFYGMWARTEVLWFLIIIDLVCARLAVYAATQVEKGDRKLAKAAFGVMIGFGALGLLRVLSMGFRFFPVALCALLLFAGYRGWQILAKEKQLQTI